MENMEVKTKKITYKLIKSSEISYVFGYVTNFAYYCKL